MKNPLTEDSLGIFSNGTEVDGIIAYGYFRHQPQTSPSMPIDNWPRTTRYLESHLRGGDWLVVVWDIQIEDWPPAAEWTDLIKATLYSMTSVGALVAWCGLEGHFADPPGLFDPSEMGRGVWSALTHDGRFFLEAHVGKPFRVLDDDVLGMLSEAISPGNQG